MLKTSPKPGANTGAAAADTAKKDKTCNCRKAADCPLQGNCLVSAIIYKATVTTPGSDVKQFYVGNTSTTFKKRFYNHTSDKAHVEKRTSTMLSRHIWKLRDSNKEPTISWSIQKQAFPYQCGSKKCDLCLSEKREILRLHGPNLLNKRSEIAGKCRHKDSFKLCKAMGVT